MRSSPGHPGGLTFHQQTKSQEAQPMRILLIAATIIGLSMPAWAEEPRPYDASALPRDEEGLSAVDAKQLRIVRRATNMCDATDPAFVRTRVTRRPCIIGSVDNAVQTSDDPALQAYHAALPLNVRYDRFRSAYYYQQMLVRMRQ
jgi:hypothetical protein